MFQRLRGVPDTSQPFDYRDQVSDMKHDHVDVQLPVQTLPGEVDVEQVMSEEITDPAQLASLQQGLAALASRSA